MNKKKNYSSPTIDVETMEFAIDNNSETTIPEGNSTPKSALTNLPTEFSKELD